MGVSVTRGEYDDMDAVVPVAKLFLLPKGGEGARSQEDLFETLLYSMRLPRTNRAGARIHVPFSSSSSGLRL